MVTLEFKTLAQSFAICYAIMPLYHPYLVIYKYIYISLSLTWTSFYQDSKTICHIYPDIPLAAIQSSSRCPALKTLVGLSLLGNSAIDTLGGSGRGRPCCAQAAAAASAAAGRCGARPGSMVHCSSWTAKRWGLPVYLFFFLGDSTWMIIIINQTQEIKCYKKWDSNKRSKHQSISINSFQDLLGRASSRLWNSSVVFLSGVAFG